MSDTTADRAKQAGHSAAGKADRAAGKADSPWLKMLGKVGVAAIGIVWILLAWISLQVAFGGSSGKSTDNSGALQELAQQPFGRVLLAVMALGLLAYAVWQAVEAVIGYQRESEDTKRLGKRIGAGAKAVIGLGLGVQAAKLVIGSGNQSSSSKQSDWTSKLLGLPAGRVLVVLVGLAVIGFAGFLIYQGVEKKFLEKLSGHTSDTVVKVGQFGYIARGVAFVVLGILVVVAGVKHQAAKSDGLDGALKTLAGQPFGKWILAVVAIGFAAYGVFTLITAPRREEG
jgi:hypothetical protein